MNREEFDHAVRAAGAILGENELLVIGSQALHASVPGDVPPEAARSIEADIAALDDPNELKADLIDGTIGEVSMFHRTFGYYAQGITRSTAILPRGWQDRLIRYETPNTNRVVAWCLEIHDLWISKALASRRKDIAFCAALIAEELVETDILVCRLEKVDGIEAARRIQAVGLIDGLSGTG
ncbi:MAG: hypothetical protein F4W94_01150 [Acidimicrobiia bacterium]|nr:hypothetical protein [bacterium]MXY73350.1 hypothetical protein [Acidimicrobiia bacterium]MYA38653.1 hypothetical protein [Acidimicrobiia bacterium]MYB79503.1 hypothetical protein [Acidimicrobiia bacterium]MYD40334.1 hypothetical protein [Acidimicrobiia bacterium]